MTTSIFAGMRLQKFTLSVVINLFLFALFFLFTNPVYFIPEDFFVLYLLSGGFGSAPSELLHYNYGMHPYITYPLKELFKLNKDVNWYTVALVVGNFIASSVMLYLVLRRKQFISTLICYILLFTVFVCQLLLHLNFSYTAILLGIAGIIVILAHREPVRLFTRASVAGVGLILLASLFRIHVLLPLFIIALPFVFYDRSKNTVKSVLLAWTLAGGLILLFNVLHQSYYTTKIAGWKQNEHYRQQIYKFYNHMNLAEPLPADKWFTEFHLIQDGFPVDTSFLSTAKLNQMFKDLKKDPKLGVVSSENLYWFFVNNKISLICILLLLLFCGSKRLAIVALASLFIFIAGYLGLDYIFSKIPLSYIATGLLLIGFCIVVFRQENALDSLWHRIGFVGLSLLVTFWSFVRIYKENEENLIAIASFKNSYSTIGEHNRKLFIVSGDTFPLRFFSIYDVPKDYPLPNFLFSEHFLHKIHTSVLKRFGVQEFRDVPFHSNVHFWGKRSIALEKYLSLANENHSFRYEPINMADSVSTYQLVP